MSYRLLRETTRPTQERVLRVQGNRICNLGPNEVLYRAHFGEDGEDDVVEKTREFDITLQNCLSGDLQDWALVELFSVAFDC